MAKGSFVSSRAEDRICETWRSGIDLDHPAAIEAAQWEQRNARLLAEARQAGQKVAGSSHAQPQSAARRILALNRANRQ